MSEIAADTGEVTLENFGDVFLWAYADYLRRHDEHVERKTFFSQAAVDAFESAQEWMVDPPSEDAVTDREFRKFIKTKGALLWYALKLLRLTTHYLAILIQSNQQM